MVRTRTASKRPAVDPLETELNTVEDSVQDDIISPATGSTATFGSSLKQFEHNTKDAGTHTPDSSRPDRSTRKRVLEVNAFDVLTNPSLSPSPAKKLRRDSSRYAPPAKYAHLRELTDIIEPNLICVFVGFNPGVRTATADHAYAHPSNLFWKLLHSSGCTDERLRPEQDVDLPQLYSMGNTNIVSRPSKDIGELSKKEMAAGTPILEEKLREFRPEAVCIVGKGIWDAIWRWRYGREIKKDEFRYGWQDRKLRLGKTEDWEGSWVFVATATSGLSAGTSRQEKEAIWLPFGEWVKSRRQARFRETTHASGE